MPCERYHSASSAVGGLQKHALFVSYVIFDGSIPCKRKYSVSCAVKARRPSDWAVAADVFVATCDCSEMEDDISSTAKASKDRANVINAKLNRTLAPLVSNVLFVFGHKVRCEA